MCAPKIQAPAPPDYAEANREAIQADIDTLPQRRLIEAQARLGQGMFEGLGDADLAQQMFMQQIANAPQAAEALLGLQRQYGTDFVNESRRQAEAFDPSGFALRENFISGLGNGGNRTESLFDGLSAPTYEAQPDAPKYATLADASPLGRIGAVESIGSGPALARLAAAERIGTGPAMERVAAAATLADSGLTASGRSMLEKQVFDELAQAGTLDPALQRAAEQAARARGASTGNLYGGGNALQEALSVQLAQIQRDDQRRANALGLLSSGQSSSDVANRLAQANYENSLSKGAFNNAASQQEYQNAFNAINQNFQNDVTRSSFNNSAAQQEYQNGAAALNQNLQNRMAAGAFDNAASGQEFANRQAVAGFNNTAADQSFQNAMAAIGQRNQSAQNTFTGQLQLAGSRAGARQQDTANVQSALGLAPVAQIAGLNQNAQGGAVPFAQGQYNGANINNNAGQLGTNFAQGIYGTQANIYGTQLANASSPFGAILGTTLGAFGGGFGKAFGEKTCHVAREVYGSHNPEWIVFYCWKESLAPAWFRKVYNLNARWVARAIKPFPAIKRAIRNWMTSKTRI